MFTLAAFYASITNGSTFASVAGVQDQSLTLDSGNRIQSPGDWQILAATALGINLSAAQFNAPSLRNMFLPQIYPGIAAAAVSDNRGPSVYNGYGPAFKNGEYISAEVSRGGADAQPVAVGLWFGPGMTPAPRGRAYTALATATIVLTAGTWVFGTLTFAQQLPVGKYAVVGMAATSNDNMLVRLAYPGNNMFRPGVMSQAAYGNVPWDDRFRFGSFAHFGEFVYNTPPNIECLGLVAGSEAVTVYLDLVKIG